MQIQHVETCQLLSRLHKYQSFFADDKEFMLVCVIYYLSPSQSKNGDPSVEKPLSWVTRVSRRHCRDRMQHFFFFLAVTVKTVTILSFSVMATKKMK